MGHQIQSVRSSRGFNQVPAMNESNMEFPTPKRIQVNDALHFLSRKDLSFRRLFSLMKTKIFLLLFTQFLQSQFYRIHVTFIQCG